MAKTHYSGVAVGDAAMGTFGGAVLCQSYRFAAPGDTPIYFNEDSFIRDVALTNDAGVSIVGTVKIGTTSGGTEVYTAAQVASTPGVVWKKVAAGRYYASSSVANSTLWIVYATSGT